VLTPPPPLLPASKGKPTSLLNKFCQNCKWRLTSSVSNCKLFLQPKTQSDLPTWCGHHILHCECKSKFWWWSYLQPLSLCHKKNQKFGIWNKNETKTAWEKIWLILKKPRYLLTLSYDSETSRTGHIYYKKMIRQTDLHSSYN